MEAFYAGLSTLFYTSALSTISAVLHYQYQRFQIPSDRRRYTSGANGLSVFVTTFTILGISGTAALLTVPIVYFKYMEQQAAIRSITACGTLLTWISIKDTNWLESDWNQLNLWKIQVTVLMLKLETHIPSCVLEKSRINCTKILCNNWVIATIISC